MSQTRIKIKKKKKKADATRRSARYWMAVGTMAAYTTFSGDAVFKLYAQQDRSAPTVQASGQTQGLTVRRFDIPPGTLDAVLAAYERTAQFSVTVPRDSMRGIWSPGVAGLYTPQGALQKLLTGTGIGYRLNGPDKATLEIQGMATAIEVTAPSLQDSLPKLTQPLVETPQSIDIVPQHIIQDQGGDYAAGYAAQCRRHKHRGRRRRRTRRQPHHPGFHRPQRHFPRRHAGLWQLLPRSV